MHSRALGGGDELKIHDRRLKSQDKHHRVWLGLQAKHWADDALSSCVYDAQRLEDEPAGCNREIGKHAHTHTYIGIGGDDDRTQQEQRPFDRGPGRRHEGEILLSIEAGAGSLFPNQTRGVARATPSSSPAQRRRFACDDDDDDGGGGRHRLRGSTPPRCSNRGGKQRKKESAMKTLQRRVLETLVAIVSHDLPPPPPPPPPPTPLAFETGPSRCVAYRFISLEIPQAAVATRSLAPLNVKYLIYICFGYLRTLFFFFFFFFFFFCKSMLHWFILPLFDRGTESYLPAQAIYNP